MRISCPWGLLGALRQLWDQVCILWSGFLVTTAGLRASTLAWHQQQFLHMASPGWGGVTPWRSLVCSCPWTGYREASLEEDQNWVCLVEASAGELFY